MRKLHVALVIIAALMLVKCEEVATFAEYDKGQSQVADSTAETTTTENSAAAAATTDSAAAENSEETITEVEETSNDSTTSAAVENNEETITEVEETSNDSTASAAADDTTTATTTEDSAVPVEDSAATATTEGSTTEQETAKTTATTTESSTSASAPTATTTTTPATPATTKRKDTKEDTAAETDKMLQQSNMATKHAQSMSDLKNKLLTIRELYASKRAADQTSAARAQAAALAGVEREFQRQTAPLRDFPLPSQMPSRPMLLRKYRQLERFDAPLPVDPTPSFYFNRPGKPEKYGNYFEADSDRSLYPAQYYPAQPSAIERRRFMDRLEKIKSTIPNYNLINRLNADALEQGLVY